MILPAILLAAAAASAQWIDSTYASYVVFPKGDDTCKGPAPFFQLFLSGAQAKYQNAANLLCSDINDYVPGPNANVMFQANFYSDESWDATMTPLVPNNEYVVYAEFDSDSCERNRLNYLESAVGSGSCIQWNNVYDSNTHIKTSCVNGQCKFEYFPDDTCAESLALVFVIETCS
jgi:hypothetical protein